MLVWSNDGLNWIGSLYFRLHLLQSFHFYSWMTHPIYLHSCILVIVADAASVFVPIANTNKILAISWLAMGYVLSIFSEAFLLMGGFYHFT